MSTPQASAEAEGAALYLAHREEALGRLRASDLFGPLIARRREAASSTTPARPRLTIVK